MGISMIVSAFKTDLRGVAKIEIIQNLFVTFMFNLTVGIVVGIACMISIDIYNLIKKNSFNEKFGRNTLYGGWRWFLYRINQAA